MTELYLIAHKVRGEPAFDIAIQMDVDTDDEPWWIIPTSGHRAYPYWSAPLEAMLQLWDMYVLDSPEAGKPILPMPEGISDHYEVYAAPKEQKRSIYDLMVKVGLRKPLERRI